MTKFFKNNFNNSKKSFANEAGFTIMEILVATTVFTVASVSIFGLFNYVLKINRRAEALRQASQGIRDFVEYMAKEIRNGQVYYFVSNGTNYTQKINGDNSAPCGPPGTPGTSATGADTYTEQENKVAVLNTDNVPECFYLGYGPGGSTAQNTYVGSGIFSKDTNPSSPGYNPNPALVVAKNGVPVPQSINPSNMRIDNLAFIVRPQKDPYTATGGLARRQPFVSIFLKATVQLGTGEIVPITYQTTVSSNKYDIPN
jgi:type II secretory pathway pseudopilin PulG